MKIVGLGDLLASFSPRGYLRFSQADCFEVCYTGAEANVCVSLSNFGLHTEYVTRLPNHAIGDNAIMTLRKYGVGTKFIARGGERIGLLYLEKGASQRPSKVIYDRKNSAICEAVPADFDFEAIFRDATWFHFTGITPALSDNAYEVVMAACRAAKANGVTISCDLNYRKNLWTTQKAKAVMETLLPFVDILIANEEDSEKVLGIRPQNTDVTQARLDTSAYKQVAAQISATYDIPYVATTLRKSLSASRNIWSAMLYHDGNVFLSKEYDIHIVNRVGAGDSFSAGLIYGFCQKFTDQRTLDFAAAASCLKHSIEQDYNLVTVEEVLLLMDGDGSGRVQR